MKSTCFVMTGDVGNGAAVIYSESLYNESSIVLPLAGYDGVIGEIDVNNLQQTTKRRYNKRNSVTVENAIPTEPKPRGRKCKKPENVAICIPIDETLGTAMYPNRSGELFPVAIYQVSPDEKKPWINLLFISKDGKWAYHRTNSLGFFANLDKITDVKMNGIVTDETETTEVETVETEAVAAE